MLQWTERPVLNLPLDGPTLSGPATAQPADLGITHRQSMLPAALDKDKVVNYVPFLWMATSPQGNQRTVHVAIRVIVKRRTNVQRNDVEYEGGTRTSVKGRQTSYICFKYFENR